MRRDGDVKNSDVFSLGHCVQDSGYESANWNPLANEAMSSKAPAGVLRGNDATAPESSGGRGSPCRCMVRGAMQNMFC